MQESLTDANFEPVDIDAFGKFSFSNVLIKLRRSLVGMHNKIFPVFIMNDDQNPVQVIVGISKLIGRQTFKTYHMQVAAASNETRQILTVTAAKRYYFLGWSYSNAAVATSGVHITDLASGAIPEGDASINDITTNINVAAGAFENFSLPFPRPLANGLRVKLVSGAGNATDITLFYIEEQV